VSATSTPLLLGVVGLVFLFVGVLTGGLFGEQQLVSHAVTLAFLVIGIVLVVGALFLPGPATESSGDGSSGFVWTCNSCDFENVHPGKVSDGDELHCSNCGTLATMKLTAAA
jgi:hypothetical protein